MTARAVLLSLALVFGAGLLPGQVQAQGNCQVSTVPLNFGAYSPVSASPLDVTGELNVSCRGRPTIIFALISPGSSGSYGGRTMLSGPETMNYNIYRNSARTQVWGDGTGGSNWVAWIKWRSGRDDFSRPVYGRIPPGQSVGAGTYVDNVIVTVYF